MAGFETLNGLPGARLAGEGERPEPASLFIDRMLVRNDPRGRRWWLVAAALAALLAISALAALGLLRLRVDDDLRALFLGADPRFDRLAELGERFALGDDVLVVLEGDVLSSDGIAALRSMEEDLFLVDRVESFDSILATRSLRDPAEGLPPLWPEPDADAGAWARATDEARAHPLLFGRTVSANGQLTLAAARIAATPPLTVRELLPVLTEIEEIVGTAAREHGLRARLTGIPTLRVEIVRSIFRDQVLFQIVGGLAGMAVAWLLLCRVAWVAVAAIGPILGMVWALGAMGLIGYPIDVINNVLAPLVLVIGFADSMHLAAHARRRIAAGDSTLAAAGAALRAVGPACVLTSLTTGIALLSLALSSADAIRRFGLAAALGCLAALLSVALATPILVALLPRRWLVTRVGSGVGGARLERLQTFLAPRATVVVAVGVLGSVGLLALALRVEPDYRYRENLPESSVAYQAADTLDRELGGASVLQIWIRMGAVFAADDPRLATALGRVHEVLGEQSIGLGVGETSFGAPFSLLSILDAVGAGPGGRNPDRQGLAELLDEVPPEWLARLHTGRGDELLVHARMPDVGARYLAPALERLQADLEHLAPEIGAQKIEVTGIAALTAVASPRLIGELLESLLMAGVVVFLLLALGLRSLRLALLAAIPNVLPLIAVTALLAASGSSLLYGSVLALTVALGIGVDDTIHFLFAFTRERRAGADRSTAVATVLREVGPVLVTTTLILVVGLSAVLASAMPTVRHFGLLTILALIFALAADLVLLPALLLLRGAERVPVVADLTSS